jgi:DNA-binding CsgD family transcriptional regulator
MIGQRLAACVLIAHGRASPVQTVAPQLLRHVYQLTPAEVQIALAIADGETLKTYAQRRDISVNTASTQLKRVFSKTGLKRQSDLVRWLLVCGTSLRPGAGSRDRQPDR